MHTFGYFFSAFQSESHTQLLILEIERYNWVCNCTSRYHIAVMYREFQEGRLYRYLPMMLIVATNSWVLTIDCCFGQIPFWHRSSDFFVKQRTVKRINLLHTRAADCCNAYTQRSLFETLLNQTEIRLYLPFSDWFWTKRTVFPNQNPIPIQNQSENGKYNLIWVWFNKI